jgi:phosphoribosylamine--glycine ligase/phosphoribosylformylglycinamidine cyclo-ligase
MTANVLVVGGGGREHALAWQLAKSPQIRRVFVAPGNGGTAAGDDRIENVPIEMHRVDDLIAFARTNDVDLTVIGPEAPLVEGIVDKFEQAGLRCFGPVAAAARLEGSKSFSKDLMRRVGVPTADYAVVSNYEEALAYVRSAPHPTVIKASGLAAGKGVVVPNSLAEAEQALHRIMVDREFGAAGDEVLIEERLTGQEATVLAFCDGTTLIPMPAAQDHKQLLDGDQGPNTGGMGAYAPTPLVDEALQRFVVTEVMEPVIRALAVAGDPYVGVLYAGMMITPTGPKVLEFNCRFGDPETQVILPLLETDLWEILNACIDGTLHSMDVTWRDGVGATVVAAAAGYPGEYDKGVPISGILEANSVPGVKVFHAGTRMDDELVTNGGRVLAVTGVQESLPMALACAYHGIEHIDFAGMQYRSDIGARRLDLTDPGSDRSETSQGITYADAGVDIDAGVKTVELIRDEVTSTYGPEVIAGIGSFGGIFDATGLGPNAVLVASTDGVGTKTKIAAALGRFEPLGHDIVNHCINDILVQGAKPLFFLDYIATGNLDPNVIAEVVSGMAAACREAGCALLGGETAEMPGVYLDDDLDVVGTIVGTVDREDIIDGRRLAAGDVVIALPSSGLHTNGYSLARKVFEHWDLTDRVAALGTTLGSALLRPHRSYLAEIRTLREAGIDPRALVHITGGGMIDNPARVLPAVLAMRIDRTTWSVPPLFSLIRSQGNIADDEMYRTFNMGIGMLVVVAPDESDRSLGLLGNSARIVGSVIDRTDDPVELV